MKILTIALGLGLSVVFPIQQCAAEDHSIGAEVSLTCATSIGIAMDHVVNEKYIDLYIDFDRVVCIERDGHVEVRFERTNRRLRGGGIEYTFSKDGKTMLSVKHTR